MQRDEIIQIQYGKKKNQYGLKEYFTNFFQQLGVSSPYAN